ncbi:hypothetical protein [Streptomyces sp. NPDC093795]|uniref:hypothetical protein n=1 Tax=Streptomyces sp. NPDC093795 TaxID=3366051 RepID=UPI0037FD8779
MNDLPVSVSYDDGATWSGVTVPEPDAMLSSAAPAGRAVGASALRPMTVAAAKAMPVRRLRQPSRSAWDRG